MSAVVPVGPPADLLCGLTNEIMKVPVRTNCGHRFERQVLEDKISEGTKKCPTCQKNLNSFDRDEAMENRVDEYVRSLKRNPSPRGAFGEAPNEALRLQWLYGQDGMNVSFRRGKGLQRVVTEFTPEQRAAQERCRWQACACVVVTLGVGVIGSMGYLLVSEEIDNFL